MAGFDPRVPYESSGQPYEDGLFYDGFSYRGENNGPWYVEVAFDLAENGVGDWFTLDDPVKGELDNVTYLLSGDLFVDVTRYVRRLAVKRGRSRTLERFIAGQCEVILDNTERLFDPTMTGGPFFGQLVPGKQVRITYETYPVFIGNTTDWDLEYALPRDATTVMKALDGFSVFATQTVPAQTMTTQLTGARIEKVLTDINWPAEQRNIDGGTASVGSDVVTGNTNALSYMQQVETSQNGLFFITRDGLVRFEDSYTGTPSGYVIGIDGIPFFDFEVVYGAEELYNKIDVDYLVTGSTTGTLTVQSASSQSAYGTFEQSFSTFLAGSAAASALGTALLTRYKEPSYRVRTVRFDFKGVPTSAQSQLMDIELGDQATLRFRPPGGGEILERSVLIDAIEHDTSPSRHIITMALTDLTFA
jgi:hypothetical protein